MIICLFPMLVFATLWDRFWHTFLIVLGSTFGAVRDFQVAQMSSKIDADIGNEKSKL